MLLLHSCANMFRFRQRQFNRGRTLMLLGGLLMVVYLNKESLDNIIFHLNAVMSGSQILPVIQITSNIFSWPSCEKNMSVNNITNFHLLPNHMQDFFYYQHCRHFPMLLDLPDKCGGADRSSEVFLLFVIKSSPQNYDRREVLRKTWANERLQNGMWTKRIFIIGTEGLDFEKKRLNKVLELEQSQYNDILQWDFKDTFYNLTLKQMLFLEWMERNCPKARFLLNGDDDVFVNTNNVFEYLESLENNDGSKHLFTGCMIRGMPPVRDSWSKYFVPVQLYELDSYLPYCSGGGFLLSGYTALVIHNMSNSIALLPIDDAYMGLCLAKAGLSPEMHLGVKPLGLHLSRRENEYDPCLYKDLLLVHRFLSAQTYLMWHSVNNPNLKCFGKAKK